MQRDAPFRRFSYPLLLPSCRSSFEEDADPSSPWIDRYLCALARQLQLAPPAHWEPLCAASREWTEADLPPPESGAL